MANSSIIRRAKNKIIKDFIKDKDIIDAGWVFKTEKECQEFCNRLNEAISSVKP